MEDSGWVKEALSLSIWYIYGKVRYGVVHTVGSLYTDVYTINSYNYEIYIDHFLHQPYSALTEYTTLMYWFQSLDNTCAEQLHSFHDGVIC